MLRASYEQTTNETVKHPSVTIHWLYSIQPKRSGSQTTTLQLRSRLLRPGKRKLVMLVRIDYGRFRCNRLHMMHVPVFSRYAFT
jgi:hypothetical protein